MELRSQSGMVCAGTKPQNLGGKRLGMALLVNFAQGSLSADLKTRSAQGASEWRGCSVRQSAIGVGKSPGAGTPSWCGVDEPARQCADLSFRGHRCSLLHSSWGGHGAHSSLACLE